MKIKLTCFIPDVRTGANGARFAYPPTFHELPEYKTFADAVRAYVNGTGGKLRKYMNSRALVEIGYNRKYIYYLTACEN